MGSQHERLSKPLDLKLERSAIYRIVINGKLDHNWAERFGGLNISEMINENGTPHTVLVGRLADQAELSGIVNALFESRYPIVSVDCLEDI